MSDRILRYLPNTPLRETWEWSSDILEARDGTEQRISRRGGAPRYKLDVDITLTNKSDINDLWESLLLSRSDAWVPEYQWLSRLESDHSSTTRLYFDTSDMDLRVNEHLFVVGIDQVFEISAVYSDGCDVDSSVNADKGTIVAPVHKMILSNPGSRSRRSVDNVADFSFNGTFNKSRSTLTIPGTSDTVTKWNSVAVLDVRPRGNNSTKETILENNIVIDNDISLISLFNNWDEAKVQITRQYLVKRNVGNCQTEMTRDYNYWRHFLQYCRGSAKKFWLPMFRYDFEVAENPPASVSSIILKDFDYVDLFNNKKITHLWLQITTTSGTHRTEVSGLGSSGDNIEVFLDVDLNNTDTIERVELLMPCRIEGDSVQWEHYNSYSLLNLTLRSAENV